MRVGYQSTFLGELDVVVYAINVCKEIVLFCNVNDHESIIYIA